MKRRKEMQHVVPIQNSIGTRLLRVVFSFYFVITLTVTLIHMAAEYKNTKSSVERQLEIFQKTFESGLADSMWNVNMDGLEATANGILEIPEIIGIKLIDITDEIVVARGLITDRAGTPKTVDEAGILREVKRRGLWNELYQKKFPLLFSLGEDQENVGAAVLYFDRSVIIEKVQLGFTYILINSIIKTIALWIIFLWFSRILLNRPLTILTDATRQINLDNLDNLKINIKTHGRNELKVLEESFNTMIAKLNLAKNRTVSLRWFSGRIGDFQSTLQMMEVAFEEISKHTEVTNSVLFYDGQPGNFKCSKLFLAYPKFINRQFSAGDYAKLFPSRTKEICEFNFATKANLVLNPYRELGIDLNDAHFVVVRVVEDQEHLMIFFRDAEKLPFDSGDVEYIRSMINEIHLAQANIHAIRENVRMENELHTAAAVQYALFPKCLPKPSNLEISAYFKSASETGGDWYSFMTEFEDYLYILIGDVTGHGTPAALVTATASATCRTLENLYRQASPPLTPAKLFSHLNKSVFDAGAPNFQMTFFVARIHLPTGHMIYSNAGHNFPFLVRKNGDIKRVLNANTRLGHTLLWDFTEEETLLHKGDRLFFFTDGLVEVEGKQGHYYGENSLKRFLAKHSELNVKELTERLVEEVLDFAKDDQLADDMTFVVCDVINNFPQQLTTNSDA